MLLRGEELDYGTPRGGTRLQLAMPQLSHTFARSASIKCQPAATCGICHPF